MRKFQCLVVVIIYLLLYNLHDRTFSCSLFHMLILLLLFDVVKGVKGYVQRIFAILFFNP